MEALYNLHGEQGGLKFEDLKNAAPLLLKRGLQPIIEEVVGASFFFSFLKANGLDENSDYEQVMAAEKIPADLLGLNQALVEDFEAGFPVAVRSNALGERGGSGIYETVFLVPVECPVRNAVLLWEAERKVFASEFSADARAYREKHGSEFGMALLVQNVHGHVFGEKYFCPALAGSAYTSYQGKRLVRIVPGLGTQAVAGDGLVMKDYLFSDFELSLELREKIPQFQAINLETGQLEAFDAKQPITEENRDIIGVACAYQHRLVYLWEALADLKKDGDFYLEWAIGPDLVILQAAPFEDKVLSRIEFDSEGKRLVGWGTDIVNHGVKKATIVVRAGLTGWMEMTGSLVEGLNQTFKDYVLIVPQTAFSAGVYLAAGTGDNTIKFRHFSNAAALVELQFNVQRDFAAGTPTINHTGNRGGQHFQSVCDREDILFLGIEGGVEELDKLDCLENLGDGVKVYQVPVEIVNDAAKGLGQFFLCGEAYAPEYRRDKVLDFGDPIYDAVREMDDDSEDAKLFMDVLDLIPIDQEIENFDPFFFNPEEYEGGTAKALENIDKFFEIAYMYIGNWEDSMLQGYLQQFQARLKIRSLQEK